MRKFFLATALAILPTLAAAEKVTVEVWADNWFQLFVEGREVLTDSVPITTERSFNAETATFDVSLPAQIAFIAKDFKENDTGLEYIGTRRQQMGDGGFIAQFRDGAGNVIGATSDATKCMVVHHAPVSTACAKERNPREGQGACASEVTQEPADWMQPGFADTDWPAAVEHSAREVRPKGGYDRIRWERSAKIIWSENLVQDNTILCRMVLQK